MTMKIRVLKPFVFTPTPNSGVRGQPQEIHFKVHPNGDPIEYDVPEAVAMHPWIAVDFADGKVENPQQAKERAAAALAHAEATAREAAAAQARAEMAVARFDRSQQVASQVSAADAKNLNTPVNALNRGGGGGDDINTPVNELQARSGAGASVPKPTTTLSRKQA